MGSTQSSAPQHERDVADLRQVGHEQELHRSLGLFSSFATAFSSISPSTGIFTLFFLALGTPVRPAGGAGAGGLGETRWRGPGSGRGTRGARMTTGGAT